MRVRVVEAAAATEEPRDVDTARIAVEPWGPGRAVVHTDDERDIWALVGRDRPSTHARPRTIEVVVDGWRFDLEVEDAARAELRARAMRDRPETAGSGRLEIRAIIPGRVISVAVVAGDEVLAGQTLLVVEAMKMQNELRAPRDGRVDVVSVGAGETIDLGDVLVTLG